MFEKEIRKVIETLAVEVSTSMEAFCIQERFADLSSEYLALQRAKRLIGKLPPQAEAVLKKIEAAYLASTDEEVRRRNCGCLVA